MKPVATHFGLMCGTCSRAREQPVSQTLRECGAPEPRQLRDGHNVWGLHGLTPHEQQRVDAANAVYRNMLQVLFALFTVGAIVTIENPTRSWLWPLLAALIKEHPNADFRKWYFNFHDVCFDNCMHGGLHKKGTRIRASDKAFTALALDCDGSHNHLPWKLALMDSHWTFSTAAEAAYPALLCKRYADILKCLLPAALLVYTIKHFKMDTLAIQGRQHKAADQLIPEFRLIETISASAMI